MAAAVSATLSNEVYAAKETAIRMRAALARRASQDAASCCAYVLRDEQTGGPIELADCHVEWHELVDEHARTIIWSAPELGKTSQIAVGRTLFELGRDPTKRICILSRTQGQSVKIIRSIAAYIERSGALRDVFPNLYPSVPWTSTALMVQRDVFSKDFSVQAVGVGGAILGSRVDILIIDDILDWKNTRTPAQRSELLRWFRSEFMGRLTADSKVIVCGNAYHPEDFLHTLAREGYVSRTYPVLTRDGFPAFPRKWSLARIAAKREELKPIEAARQLDCVARKDSDSLCKEEWIRKCLARGVGVPLYRSIEDSVIATTGIRLFTGVDIGVGKKKVDAKSVITTIGIWPNGDVQLVSMEDGRWSGREIVERVVSAHVRFRSMVFVESNAAQKFLLDFAHEVEIDGKPVATSLLCVLPFNTGNNKNDPVLGVVGIFAELQTAQFIIPSDVDEHRPGHYRTSEPISEWLSECENYDPNRHTGDHLMSVWIARHGARQIMTHFPTTAQVSARVIGPDPAGDEPVPEERRAVLEGWEIARQAIANEDGDGDE